MTAHLDLKNAIHVGHSTGGGEVVALSRAARRRPGDKGGDDQRRAAADAEDSGQSGRLAEEVFDGSAGAARRQPLAVLSRRASGPFSASTGRA